MHTQENKFESFRYPMVESTAEPSMAESLGLMHAGNGRSAAGATTTQNGLGESPSSANIDAELKSAYAEGRAEGFREGLEQGRGEGEARGRSEARAQFDSEHLAEGESRKRNAAAMMKDFLHAREQYEREIEREAVRLSLAIAARILRREAQMDPLLLTGAVRVALGQLSESSRVTLHVPAVDHRLWQEAVEHLPNLPKRPAVVGEDAMEPGECRIEAEMGSVDLSLKSQLVEIERGFFDRIGRETRASEPPSTAEAQNFGIAEAEYLSEDEPVR